MHAAQREAPLGLLLHAICIRPATSHILFTIMHARSVAIT